MARFHYLVLDAAGAEQLGVIEARDEAAAVASLRGAGHLPVRLSATPLAATAVRPTRLARMGVGEVADMTRELAIMLGAGQDLDRALRYVAETAPSARVTASAEALRALVRNGASFASALAAQPASFPPLYLGMVQAGEAGGRLAPALAGLADTLERERALAASVRTALVYPAILLIAASLSIMLILTQVLPQFVPLFAEAGASLPASARLLLAAGDFVAADGVFVLLGAVLLWSLLKAAARNATIGLAMDRLKLRLPVSGGLLREAMAARFTRTLGTLLANGVPLIGALGIVRNVMLNRSVAAAIDAAIQSAASGAGLSGPLAAAGIFPVRTVHLLRLGEENAELAVLALRAADIHDERTRLAVQRLLAALVPAITVVMGGIIAAIVATLLTAMLSLNDLAG